MLSEPHTILIKLIFMSYVISMGSMLLMKQIWKAMGLGKRWAKKILKRTSQGTIIDG